MNDEKKRKLEEFIGALLASCDEGYKKNDLKKALGTQENLITEQHIFKKPIWNPGSPCMVSSLFSSDKCPKYSENCACTDTSCKHNKANKKFFELLKRYEQAQAQYDKKIDIVEMVWKQFVRS